MKKIVKYYNVAVEYVIDERSESDKLRTVRNRANMGKPVQIIEVDGNLYHDYEVKKYEEWEECPTPTKTCENCGYFHYHISNIAFPIEVIYCEYNKEHHVRACHPACSHWVVKE